MLRLAGLLLLFASRTLAQPVSLASFTDARAVAVDPAGVIYVVEGARETLIRIHPDGVLERLGGRGAGAGQFDGLADIDPTNGLVLVTADAGNGRIQRFSSEFFFLDALAVDPDEDGAVYRKQGQEAASGPGRPIAVATAQTEELYVLDADRGAVLVWDRERRFERIIGGYDAGDGALLDPIAMALDPTSRILFVLDTGRPAIQAYDLQGGFDRTLLLGDAIDARALTVYQDRLYVVTPDRLVQYHTRGHREGDVFFDLPDPAIDVAAGPAGVYVLTRRGLFLYPHP